MTDKIIDSYTGIGSLDLIDIAMNIDTLNKTLIATHFLDSSNHYDTDYIGWARLHLMASVHDEIYKNEDFEKEEEQCTGS